MSRARIASVVISAIAIGACSLFTSLDGLSTNTVIIADASSSTSSGGDGGDSSLSSSSSGDSSAAGNDAAGLGCNEDALVLALSFDEMTGETAHDCSPTRADGVFKNVAAGNIAWGKRNGGGALEFSKSGGYVLLAPNKAFDFTSSMTVAAFIRSDSKPSGGYIGLPWHYTPSGFEVIIDGSDDRFYMSFNFKTGEVGGDFPALTKMKWTHIASVFEVDTRFELFVDGKSVLKKLPPFPGAGRPDPNAITGDEMRIGSIYDGNIGWTGGIDELRIYKRALSSQEIESLSQR